MIPKTGKTLTDYFEAAARPRGRHVRKTFDADFLSVLGRTSGTAAPRQDRATGLTIRDYILKVHPGAPIVLPASAPNPMPPEAVAEAISAATVQDAPARSEEALIDRCIAKAGRDYDLPESLIRGVIRFESAYRPDAVSPAGAMGLMQLMPGTAKELGVDDPFDVSQNIDGGSRYLRQMMDMFDGDMEKALAAYNAGPGTVRRYGGVPPYAETRRYVERVTGYLRETSTPLQT